MFKTGNPVEMGVQKISPVHVQDGSYAMLFFCETSVVKRWCILKYPQRALILATLCESSVVFYATIFPWPLLQCYHRTTDSTPRYPG